MNEILTPEQTQALLAAIPKIEQAGGPEWYAWCDLYAGEVSGITLDIYEGRADEWRGSVISPPAVAAAVVAWAANLHKWAYSQGFGGRLCLVSCGTATVLYEALALISAVAEGLGEGCPTCEGRWFPAKGVDCPDCDLSSGDEQ